MDYVKRRTKQILMVLLVLLTMSQLIVSLSCAGILPFSKPLLYSSMIFGRMAYNGTPPLYFELAMECVYPFGQRIAGSLLLTMNYVSMLLYYSAFMLPQSDVKWMNWVTVTGLGVCVLVLSFFREKYTRLEIDACNDFKDKESEITGEYKILT